MATAQEVLKWFQNQIGYKEGKNNSNKFSSAMGRPAESWCADFIDAGFKACGALNLITSSASCTAKYRGMKALEVNKNSLRPGDIVFFDWDKSGDCDHVGIVESASTSRVTTIEGNTSSGNSGSQSNGDGVYRRYRTYSQIAHAVRPKYTAAASGSASASNKEEYCDVNVLMIKKGSKGNTVKTAQTLLKYRHGYNIAVDGDFGPATDAAVRAFQKSKAIGVDGIVGSNTWNKLISG